MNVECQPLVACVVRYVSIHRDIMSASVTLDIVCQVMDSHVKVATLSNMSLRDSPNWAKLYVRQITCAYVTTTAMYVYYMYQICA